MSYKIDFRSLSDMQVSIKNNVNAWSDALNEIEHSIDSFISAGAISGKGADSINLYLSTVHKQIIGTSKNLIELYKAKFNLYQLMYAGFDNSADALFKYDDFEKVKVAFPNYRNTSISIADEVFNTLNSISDIFSCEQRSSSDFTFNEIVSYPDNIGRIIAEIEDNVDSAESQFQNVIPELEQLYQNIRNVIQECASQSRSFKSDFSPDSIIGISSYSSLVVSNVAIKDDLDANHDIYNMADIYADQKAEDIAEIRAKEERERQAKIWKTVVNVACVAVSVGVIIATGGAATPLILGVAGAATSVAKKVTEDITDHYVEHGNLKDMNWKNLTIDVGVAGVTGFISGYAGAGAKAVFGDGIVVGTVENIIEGVGTRTVEQAGEALKGENANWGNVFDLKEIVKDTASGVVDGVGGKITDSVKNKTAISGALNDASKIKRAVTGGMMGATEKVAEGGATRGIEAMVEGKDIKSEVFNVQKITGDALNGGAKGVANSAVKAPSAGEDVFKKEVVTDENGNKTYRYVPTDETVTTPNKAPNPEKWLESGGSIKKDSNGNVIYREAKDDLSWSKKLNSNNQPQTKFYDKNGNIDYSRSSASVGTRANTNKAKFE